MGHRKNALRVVGGISERVPRPVEGAVVIVHVPVIRRPKPCSSSAAPLRRFVRGRKLEGGRELGERGGAHSSRNRWIRR